jgi:hypothetical protein
MLAGVLFKLPGERRSRALSAFGQAFEDYNQQLLRRIYPPSTLLADQFVSGVTVSRGGREIGELDAVVVQAEDAVFFELKEAWLRDDLLKAGAEQDFIDNLQDRYASPTRGTGQLAKVLRTLAELSSDEWPDPLRGVRIVFPILVTYDGRLDSAFHAFFLQRFGEQLGLNGTRWQPYPELPRPGGLRVAPLSVLSVDELELLEEVVTRGARLIDVVREYALENLAERGTFEEFLRSSRYGGLVRWNHHLVDAGLAGLRRAQELLFGNSHENGE